MGRNVQRIWPKWVQTVGAMRDSDVKVQAACSKCGTHFKVDLDTICAMKGRNFSLIDKRPKCRKWGCEGDCVFLYSIGINEPFMALKSR